ncbi:hypothetical protein Poli38472_001888 [Pythium oligandrum]|uniref:Protein kinase domain-containing protein n=1 Tax=Pythium oligandrum TaxID=41045 RepID=A0A8K1CVL4_PYTOL|nr:hypothetical protein Poli38472_001888 [Pythium oligandrum]|eukprot:TMW69732.1 hypothetical protein Poli38472_001888 [Pythium oligandrum]
MDVCGTVEEPTWCRKRGHDVTLWDFAGQDEFRAAHTLFFSQRALYLICVDVDEFDQVMRKAHACEDDDEVESLVLEFVRERVWRWFLSIFARQPEAECFVIATKTDALGSNDTSRLKLLESELFTNFNELKQRYSRESLREIEALQKLLAQSKADASIDTRIESLQQLQKQLEASIPTSWIGLNVYDPSSVEHARTSIEDLLKQSDRSFVMSDKYSRVLKRVEKLREQSQQAMKRNRIQQSFVSLPGLVQKLMGDIQGLTEDEAKTILKTLHDLGDVLCWKQKMCDRNACGLIGQKGPVIHLEALGINDRESSSWLRDPHDAIEGVLDMFPGILVNRRAVRDGARWNLDEWIPKWRKLPDNRRAFQLREYSWPPYDVVEWYRRAGGGARKWFISPESIVKCDGPALATGSLGMVYQAKWQHTDVVVKEMTESEIRRFMRKVNLWWELRHDNVVRFLGANDRIEPYFMVSSYATNGPLVSYPKREKMRNGRVLVWRKLREVAAGLCHLHGHSIVHGDLKGNNIVVARDGTAMLVDFGLSFVEAGSLSVVKEIEDTLGAMQRRAPEFAKLTIERPTRKSDVYSLGMCIVEAVTGETPWNGYRTDEIQSYLRNGEVKVDKPEAMTDAQWELVRQMITPSPKDRPELDAVISKLEEFAKEEESAENEQLNPYKDTDASVTPDAA